MLFAINSIYRATEGEGVHIGTPQVFVRFQGCAIGCLNCDSKETWDFSEATMTLESVMARVHELSGDYPHRLKRVSITGGDPLHPKHTAQVLALVTTLKKEGYYINIEAAGTRILDEVFDAIDFISFDLKTPSTGVRANLNLLQKLTEQYQGKAQVKCVISDKKDFEFAFDSLQTILKKVDYQNTIPWVLTPCYEPGEDFPRERFLNIISMNEDFGAPFRVIGQQHKWMHGPNKKEI
jgi:7-carboxy-7-deazaguanine synthase